jgi:hypothetical protein
VTAISRFLVEADAQARQAFSEQGRQLQEERTQIGQQRDALEVERRQIAAQREREPLIAQAIMSTALLAACLLPLLLCYIVLKAVTSAGQDDIALGELLVKELVSGDSRLLLALAPPCSGAWVLLSRHVRMPHQSPARRGIRC